MKEGFLDAYRAASTSEVTSGIVGAYPVDVAPIEEATDRNSIINIARGDWSDEFAPL